MGIIGRLLVIGATLLFFSGCASTSTPGDPFEAVNRKSWDFNYQVMDKYALKPAAEGYETIPQPIRQGMTNLLSNLSEPLYAVNNLLQWKVTDSGSSVLRFVVNTTIGLVGLFDPATDMGLMKKEETFAPVLHVIPLAILLMCLFIPYLFCRLNKGPESLCWKV